MEIATSQVVEYVEGQRFFCALCLAKKGNRYHLLTHLGREINLSPNRFVHISAQRLPINGRNSSIQRLQEINARRDDLKREIDIPELWELLQDEQPSWSPAGLAGLAFREPVESDHEAAVIRAVIDEHTHFKFKEGTITVQSAETVQRLLDQRAREEERQVRLNRGIKWLEAVWAEKGEAATVEGWDQDPDVSFWVSVIQDFCIRGDESEHASLVTDLFKSASLSSSTAPFETIVKIGLWGENQNIELLRQGIVSEFPGEVDSQARRLARFPADRTDREDLTALYTVTIDGPETADLDDALSFTEVDGGWEVGIHITDIGLSVEPGSPLFCEAVRRATSIYLPELIIPMMPKELSQKAWSLNEGEDRVAISFFVHLDEEGNILSHRITRSLIRVDRRMTYDEADADILARGSLHAVHLICTKLQKQRIESGALPLPIPELAIHVDARGGVEIELSQPGPARFLVAELMILANSLAAKFLKHRNIPALFRMQPEPRERIISGMDTDLQANFRQRRLISRGNLSLEPSRHHGLGLDVYTTVTSPLRRGLDLLIQQQIASTLLNGRPLHSEEDLDHLLGSLEEGLGSAAAVRQWSNRYWILKHIQIRGGPMKAWILERGPQKILAVLSDYLVVVELPRRPGAKYVAGQEITVKATRVDPRENILKVGWEENAP